MKGDRKVKDLYTDLLEVVEPYLSDFTGYDEEEQAFNIVLAVKELLSEFNIENEKLKSCLQEIKEIAKQCVNKDTCYDCKYFNDCYIGDAKIPTYDICKLLIQKITKAEEE